MNLRSSVRMLLGNSDLYSVMSVQNLGDNNPGLRTLSGFI